MSVRVLAGVTASHADISLLARRDSSLTNARWERVRNEPKECQHRRLGSLCCFLWRDASQCFSPSRPNINGYSHGPVNATSGGGGGVGLGGKLGVKHPQVTSCYGNQNKRRVCGQFDSSATASIFIMTNIHCTETLS